MTTLKAKIPTLDGLPEPYHALYTKSADGYDLTGVEGYAPADREKTKGVIDKERNAASTASNKLKPWLIFGDRKPEEIQTELDKIEEYKLAAKGKLDESEIANRVEARLKTLKAPLERQIAELTENNEKAQAKVTAYEKAQEQAHIRAEIQKQAAATSALPETYAPGGGLLALLEGQLQVEVEVDKDGNRTLGKVTGKDGTDVAKMLTNLQTTQGYFWAPSKGGGAGAGGGTRGLSGKNPWKKDSFNFTEQMAIMKQDPEKAKRMQAEAGNA